MVAAAHQIAGGQIQSGVAQGQLVDLIALPPQQSIDAGQQLPGVEGLGEIVVRPGVQPLNAILRVGFGGEHQNGGGAPVGANPACHRKAVQLGHHHIQNQQVIDPQLRILRAGLAVINALRLKALGGEQRLDRIRQQNLVLDNQNFHLYTLLHSVFSLYYRTNLK